MRYGAAHAQGLYTVPAASGTQVMDGADIIFDAGLKTIKLYLTPNYATDYALESWSSAPTTLTELAQTSEIAAVLAMDWETVVLTAFSFANGTTNWWIPDPSNAKLAAERAEVKALAVHLLTTYSGTGKRFILQNWEGDWAYLDSTTTTTWVDRRRLDYCAAFFAARQRGVEEARAETAHAGVTVLHAIEVNRVVDAVALPHRRRLLNDLAPRIKPDMISYSAYDSTIVDQGGWLANYAAWEAATVPMLERACRRIRAAWPGVPFYIGEFGLPENEAPGGSDVAAMLERVAAVVEAEGAEEFLYWQVFDNEAGAGPPTYRGFWLVDDSGSETIAGATMAGLAG